MGKNCFVLIEIKIDEKGKIVIYRESSSSRNLNSCRISSTLSHTNLSNSIKSHISSQPLPFSLISKMDDKVDHLVTLEKLAHLLVVESDHLAEAVSFYKSLFKVEEIESF